MLKELLAMFGFEHKPEPKTPDPIAAQTTIAIQRNARASQNAQETLEAMLARNDTLRGAKNHD